MRNDLYPQNTVTAILETDLVTTETKKVLKTRLERKETVHPSFFDDNSFLTLNAVCACLIPQHNRKKQVDIAGCLDSILAEGKGNGWRYDEMPPDNEAFLYGLSGINETSQIMFEAAFGVLDTEAQHKVLCSIQDGTAGGKTWERIAARLFFEELLAQVVELYYSHPFAKEEIGEVAMADAKGWQKIGLNEHEAHEPQTISSNNDKQPIP